MNFPYDNPTEKTYSQQTMRAIEDYLKKTLDEISCEEHPLEHRNHLGVSLIGEDCARKLWYIFRWCKLEQFDGRMRRLFHRGTEEEKEFIRKLYLLGFFVRSIDPTTNKQYRFSSIGGHYGGSGDSILLMPWDRGDDGQRLLGEFKTHNLKQFKLLESQRVKISHPKHWAQMCEYGFEFKTRYALYCGICKDNDEVHFEFLELDWNYAQILRNKAQNIIISKFAPPRISDNPDYHICKFCHFSGICHRHEATDVNCRSCRHSEPIENEKWKCNLYDCEIPKDKIAIGCTSYATINN